MRFSVSLLVLAIVLLFSTGVTAQELVLYYPFDGAGDDVIDESGNGNDGKFDAGNANRVGSKDANFGNAMEFDGQSRIAVEDSNTLQIDTEISFVMWIKNANEAGGTGTLPRIISRAADVHELAMDSGHMQRGSFAIYFGGNPGWTSCMPVDLEWHHIAVTFDGGEFVVYLDGEIAFELQGGGTRTFSSTVYIGSRHDLGSSEYYQGLVDELAIYAGVLTKEQVGEVMLNGVLGNLMAVSPQDKLTTVWGEAKSE